MGVGGGWGVGRPVGERSPALAKRGWACGVAGRLELPPRPAWDPEAAGAFGCSLKERHEGMGVCGRRGSGVAQEERCGLQPESWGQGQWRPPSRRRSPGGSSRPLRESWLSLTRDSSPGSPGQLQLMLEQAQVWRAQAFTTPASQLLP